MVLERASKSTPDWSALNAKRQEHFVLVTGTARARRQRNDILSGCRNYGLANTTSDVFIMKRGPFQYETNQAPEPMVFEFPATQKQRLLKFPEDFPAKDLGKVQGEMWGVPLRVLAELDAFMGNGEGVIREKRYISLVNSEHEIRNHLAWMYLVNFDHFEEYTCMYQLYNTNRTIPNTGSMIYFYSG
jgi:gamma-glutamylcyclotransferase (GGCT)/AIG2-like uncharacterized protein YtfP